ncbi:unnamed protein product, partial [Protopolystoma xenopodis]
MKLPIKTFVPERLSDVITADPSSLTFVTNPNLPASSIPHFSEKPALDRQNKLEASDFLGEFLKPCSASFISPENSRHGSKSATTLEHEEEEDEEESEEGDEDEDEDENEIDEEEER